MRRLDELKYFLTPREYDIKLFESARVTALALDRLTTLTKVVKSKLKGLYML